MFWRKSKPNPITSSDLLTLASRLGVERRVNVRVRYPQLSHVCKLPEIAFRGQRFIVQDLSIGGCCLLDAAELLGSEIGQEIELEIHWITGREVILARIVSRVDQRRHIQFMNLGVHRQNLLKKYMNSGVRGLSVRRHASEMQADSPLRLMAAELWSSLQGDSVVLESDVHRLAQIEFAGDSFLIFKEAWPSKGSGSCSRVELEQIILFLTNVPAPSPLLLELRAGLESRLSDARQDRAR